MAALVVLAGLPAGVVGAGGGGTPSVPSTSPALNVTAETHAVGSASNVTVAYNLTGEVDAGDISLQLGNGTHSYGANNTLSNAKGTVNLTVPAGVPGGDHRVRVDAYNTSAFGPPNASQTAVVSTDSPVVVEGYRLSTATPAAGETVTVDVTLNNTAASKANFSARVYTSDSAVADANNTTVSLADGELRHVELNVSYPGPGTYNLTVNDETPTPVTVGGGGGGGGGPGGPAYTTVSAGNVTLPVGQSGTFDVTYDLGDGIDATDAKLEVSNFTATLDTNDSLVDSDTVQMTVPARAMAGDERLQVAVVNDTTSTTAARTVVNVSVRGNVTVESVTPPATAVASAGKNVSVTLNNTGPSAETFEISVFDDATSRFPVGSKFVSVPANGETTYEVSAAYTTGTRTTYLGNVSYGTTQVYPAATVESVTHLSGPANDTALASSIDTGSTLTVELRNGTDQDLAPTGVTESSRFRVVMHVNHSVDPGLVIANARNVSWTVQNTSQHYVVTVEAQPLESQFMYGAPSLSNWGSLSDAQDRADDKLLWYSVSFVDEDSLYNANMTNMTIATDAQTFGTPRYDEANDSIDIELAAPHYTVSDTQNDGIYQATIPSAMLGQWGVSSPDELAGEYQGQSRSITSTSNDDGSVDVSMDIHYSSGKVSLKPDASGDGGSSSGDSGDGSSGGGDSDSGDDRSDGDTGDSDSGDSTDDDSATGGSDDANESAFLPELDGPVTEVEAVRDDDGSSSAVVENVSANETLRIRLSNDVASNASAGANGTAANDSTGATNASDRPTVNGLDLNLREDAASVGVNVSASDAVPDGTPELESQSDDSESVGYLSIDVSGAGDDDIENATITFSVSAAELAARNASPDEVRLHRYHDGEWRALETVHLGGDRYAAVTPGFSVFAVSTKEAETKAADDAAEADDDATPTETESTTAATAEPTARPTAAPSATSTSDHATETSTGVPGFGVVVALAALLTVALRARRQV